MTRCAALPSYHSLLCDSCSSVPTFAVPLPSDSPSPETPLWLANWLRQLASKGLSPSSFIPYLYRDRMPMPGTHNVQIVHSLHSSATSIARNVTAQASLRSACAVTGRSRRATRLLETVPCFGLAPSRERSAVRRTLSQTPTRGLRIFKIFSLREILKTLRLRLRRDLPVVGNK